MMHRLSIFLIAALVAAPAPARARQPSPPSVDLPADLDRVLRDYEDAWQARDADALAALFHPDAFRMARGQPPVRGRAAIRAQYEGSGGPLALRALDYAAEGDVGWIIGGYARAPGEPDVGKFSLTLRRVDGRWLIVTDMDNGNG